MKYAAPYTLYSALTVDEDVEIKAHVDGYEKLLNAICDDTFDFSKAIEADVLTAQIIEEFIGSVQ